MTRTRPSDSRRERRRLHSLTESVRAFFLTDPPSPPFPFSSSVYTFSPQPPPVRGPPAPSLFNYSSAAPAHLKTNLPLLSPFYFPLIHSSLLGVFQTLPTTTYELEIVAKDMAGSEVGLTGTATATITIADKNDHAPEFTHPLVRGRMKNPP